jgi:8-oxo-dGTP pyrophosphatase MutT (NUDIX family)
MNEVEVRSCGFIVFRQFDAEPMQLLLMKHRDRWDLPKGHVDPGESEMECALRELEEETAIRAGDIKIDPEFRYSQQYEVRYSRNDYRPQQKELVIFLARLQVDVEIELTEHQGYEWFEWNPPMSIQEQTIDPLLAQVAEYWS